MTTATDVTEAAADPSALSSQLLARLRGEFLEMPGLTLTAPQAMRLWNLDTRTCAAALAALVGSGFLTASRSGVYRRAGG